MYGLYPSATADLLQHLDYSTSYAEIPRQSLKAKVGYRLSPHHIANLMKISYKVMCSGQYGAEACQNPCKLVRAF